MGRFKDLEAKLKKKLRVNVPTASDKSGYLRMVRAKEGNQEKLIYYGKVSKDQSIKDQYANYGLKCDKKMSKLTQDYWICRDLLGRKQKGIEKHKKDKEIAVKKDKAIR